MKCEKQDIQILKMFENVNIEPFIYIIVLEIETRVEQVETSDRENKRTTIVILELAGIKIELT